jgi:excisionase family DNA binding protein
LIPYSVVDENVGNDQAAVTEGDGRLRPLLVTAVQAAPLLAIGRTTLYELIGAGAITPMRIGRCVRFSMVELERFVADGCPAHPAPRAAPTQIRVGTQPRASRSSRSGETLRWFDSTADLVERC